MVKKILEIREGDGMKRQDPKMIIAMVICIILAVVIAAMVVKFLLPGVKTGLKMMTFFGIIIIIYFLFTLISSKLRR